MSFTATETTRASLQEIVAKEAQTGLRGRPRTLTAWLFYDERGSQLFEEITTLPEYYLTRTERALFHDHADEIVTLAAAGQRLTMIELGAGTASKTGLLLSAAVRHQNQVLYQPIDVSVSALAEAETLEGTLPGVQVKAQVADYTTGALIFERPSDCRVLALYIGSSIGNFFPDDAVEVLTNLRRQMRAGDSLLLGTDLAPGAGKSVAALLAAYDDAAGVTADFNRNVLVRLNRELGANFDVDAFRHVARWNARESRIEMHLESTRQQRVLIPRTGAVDALSIDFESGETIHTENSYKFTLEAVADMLSKAGFTGARTWRDGAELFAVTLAVAA